MMSLQGVTSCVETSDNINDSVGRCLAHYSPPRSYYYIVFGSGLSFCVVLLFCWDPCRSNIVCGEKVQNKN